MLCFVLLLSFPCLQRKYVFGDYGATFLVADVYGGGNTFLDSWKWKTFSFFEVDPADSAVVEFLPVELYGWGTDKAKELYGLSSEGIFRITDASKCGFSC